MTCFVKQCKNIRRFFGPDTKISFHRFPVDPEIFQNWLHALGRQNEGIAWSKNKFVCSVHFKTEDFVALKAKRRSLKSTAVPVLNLYGNDIDDKEVIGQAGISASISKPQTSLFVTPLPASQVIRLGESSGSDFSANTKRKKFKLPYRYPLPKDAGSKLKWLETVGATSAYNHAVVCNDHFVKKDFIRNGIFSRKLLRPKVVRHRGKKKSIPMEADDPLKLSLSSRTATPTEERNSSHNVDMHKSSLNYSTESRLGVCDDTIDENNHKISGQRSASDVETIIIKTEEPQFVEEETIVIKIEPEFVEDINHNQ